MMRWAAVIAFAFTLLIAGVFGAVLVGLGCDENLRAGTARNDVCTTVGEVGSAGWWSLAFAPALVFSAVALLSGRGGRVTMLAGAIFVALVVVDAFLISIVTSNLLA